MRTLFLILLAFNTITQAQTTVAGNDTIVNPRGMDSVTIIFYLKQNLILLLLLLT